METIILALNLDKVCRVCLLESDRMFSIYSELLEQNSDQKMPTICEILVNISNINVQSHETLPNMICAKCIDSAHSAYKFQQQCNKSQSILETYLEQIKDLETEAIHYKSKDCLQIDESTTKDDDILDKINSSNSNDLISEDDLLEEGLKFMNDNYLMDDERKSNDENDDCEDLKNCIPLGEDTVDQLIKDNFRVENLEMISPKLNFSLDIKKDDEETGNVIATNEKSSKDIPSMDYYKNYVNDGTVNYNCNICTKSFKSPNNLRIHLKSHDEDKPYVCTECKKGFKVYGSLLHHIRSHSGEQPFECKECGKKYKQSGTLTAHMRIHTGSKPFMCSICNRGFRQAPDLTYHMRTHTKEKPYMCNVCGKTMSMQCHLVQHMRSHTGEKPFKCSICEKAFPSSTRLKRHAIVHTTLKPYNCTICDKSFNRSSSLKVHMKVHSGIKSHSCSICHKSFLWAHSLRAHMLTHSKNCKQTKAVNNNVLNDNDNSIVKFTTFALYADDKAHDNDSFAIFSTEDMPSGNDTFQVCAMAVGDDCDLLETFRLYSQDGEHISAGNMQLSAVRLQ